MQQSESETTIGTGGWALVAGAFAVCFVVLRFLFHYHLFPAIVFALAIALVVLLILRRLALAVTRYEDAEASRQVRRIVPASSVGEGATRVSGIEGAQASTVAAVPVRPDPATPMPQRPSAVVTPLSRLDPAPILPAQPVVAPPAPAPVAEKVEPVKVAEPKVAAKPKVEAKPKADGAAKAEFKSKAQLTAEAATPVLPPVVEAPKSKPTAKPAAKPKPKPEAKPAVAPAAKTAAAAKAAPVAKATPVAKTTAPAAKAAPATPAAKPAAKPKAAPKPKAVVGLVRLTAPRGGKADDLKLIDGVGPALEKLVNSLGFYHFDQIAAWTQADVALVDAELKSFKGRVTRDKWVVQARILANGGTVEEAAAAAKA